MRIRIALATAVTVIVLPALLFALFSSTSAASARVIRHEAVSQHRVAKVDMKLMSYAQAQKVAQLATYSNAVAAQQEVTYLKEIAFLKAYQQQQQLQAAQRAAAAANQAQAAAAAARAQAAAVAAPAPAPAGVVSDATSTNTPHWACIRQHESSGDYSAGNGGAYQFQFGTWNALTGLPSPAQDYPPSVQDAAALKLYSQRGWEPWSTRYVCGL